MLAAFWPRKKQIWDYAIIVVLFALFPLALAFSRVATWSIGLQMSLLLPAAGLLIYGMADRLSKENKSRREWIFLDLWLLGIMVYTGVVLYHAAVKYLLPAFLPITLVVASQARERFESAPVLLWFKVITVALTGVLGFFVATADYQFASAYEEFAKGPAAEELKDYKAGWFSGEFGWRYYMEQQGYRYLLAMDDRPQQGDIIMIPFMPGPSGLNENLAKRVELVEEKSLEANLPMRIINAQAGAGFYGHRWGILPYSISGSEVDHIFIYKVVR